MSEILRAVTSYVQTPLTEYAFLINGGWGCGKTYLWRQRLAPAIRQLTHEGEPWKPLYVSLYGCRSAAEIDDRLFLAAFPALHNKWIKYAHRLGGWAVKPALKALVRFELPSVNLRWMISTKGAVLCFDDLERTEMSIRDLLGYINSFVEHESAKTVILCNESEIQDTANYKPMKEKLVGTSFDLRADPHGMLVDIANRYKSDRVFQHLLLDSVSHLVHLFEHSQTGNLRALRRAVSALSALCQAIEKADIDPQSMRKQLINVVAPAAFELFGRAADPDDVRRALVSEQLPRHGFNLFPAGGKEGEPAPYEERFAKQYFDDIPMASWDEAVGCAGVAEYLITGILDEAAIIEWARRITTPPDPREEQWQRLNFDPRQMDDDEFVDATTKLMQDIQAGRVTDIGRFVGVFLRLSSFAEANLLSISTQQLLETFDGALDKLRDRTDITAQPSLRESISHGSLSPSSSAAHALVEKALGINDEFLAAKLQARVIALASAKEERPDEFLDAVSQSQGEGLRYIPVFHYLSAGDIAKWYLSLPNDLKIRFMRALQARYGTGHPVKQYAPELPFLSSLAQTVSGNGAQATREQRPVAMSQLVNRDFLKTLSDAVARLEQSTKSPTEEGV